MRNTQTKRVDFVETSMESRFTMSSSVMVLLILIYLTMEKYVTLLDVLHYCTKIIKNHLSPVLGTTMSVSNYGNLWKMDGPTEVCKEDTVPLVENCGDEVKN